jgi:hypothetical protein
MASDQFEMPLKEKGSLEQSFSYTVKHSDMLARLQIRPIALSIRQPACGWIVKGLKDIENRSWPTRFRGPLLIHAARSVYPEYRQQVAKQGLPLGGIVGMVIVEDCVTNSNSRWFRGKFGFVLANPAPLEFLRCKGALGLFTPEIDAQEINTLSKAT